MRIVMRTAEAARESPGPSHDDLGSQSRNFDQNHDEQSSINATSSTSTQIAPDANSNNQPPPFPLGQHSPLGHPPSSSFPSEAIHERIDADLLIPGRGEPIEDGSVVFERNDGGKILFAGARSALPSQYNDPDLTSKATKVRVLMPGLWDCHVHFWGSPHNRLDEVWAASGATAGVRIARSLLATLNAGFTSVRELSGYGADVAGAVDEGWIPGPKIYPAVAMLSQTGGHGDVSMVPLEEIMRSGITSRDGSGRGLPIAICNGKDECIRAVRLVARKGARIIKIATAGGISSDGDDLFQQQFDDEEIQAIVKEAKLHQLAVAAHAHGKVGIMAALRNGCLTVEHCSQLDEEALALAREKNAICVFTRGAVEAEMALRDHLAPEQRRKIEQVYEQHAVNYRRAVAAGVRTALGSDVVSSGNAIPWTHGRQGLELRYAVEIGGMTPLQAIEAATASAPATLGDGQAPKSGWLREGYDADMIALDEDPLADIGLLADSRNVKGVWKGGKRFKWDGKPVGMLGLDE